MGHPLLLSVHPTKRFSKRADYYAKFRPRYPRGVIKILEKEMGFDKSDVVADIASGTGLLTRLFLENGNRVFAVEPNVKMRKHAEKDLSRYENFVSIKGTAEHTTLPAKSLDLVTVGQALHWFNPATTIREFNRILKRGGNLMVIYNDRKQDAFGRAYGRVVKRNEKDRSDVPNPDDRYVRRFFKGGKYSKFKVQNEQVLDFEGLLGRLLSASYMPTAREKSYARFHADVKKIFETYSSNGRVRLRYDATFYLGPVADRAPRPLDSRPRRLGFSNRL
jgi:ubiquinone/menaquinone biosynthesis C-methylase UbiE